jgi:hypothetical protein
LEQQRQMALASGLLTWTALIPKIGGTLRTHRPNRRTVTSAQLASVDPTEASDGCVASFGRIDRINLDSIGFGVVAPTIARIHRHLVRRYSRSHQAHSRAYGQ